MNTHGIHDTNRDTRNNPTTLTPDRVHTETTQYTRGKGTRFVPGRRHPPLPAELAQLLRDERQGRGWTLHHAAEATGLGWAYIANLELRDRCPSVLTARILCTVYELDSQVADALVRCAVSTAGRCRKATEYRQAMEAEAT